ncbi:MAG: GntR family transcriptional regulator [Anaerolineaceae bacterium]|nr:GntR family transcriptional regulator [Anaerolineaceae bacterium]MCB9101545.1 GntR family transcriptional regulator [Anaerolineales bacterium]
MEKMNLSFEIFDTLKKRIIRWEYLPGQRLIEESLCHEFGVSRIPVREALRMLEDNKLVDKVPYRGCTVKQPDLDELNNLYDVRLALELFVVEQLAARGMPSDVLQALFQTWRELFACESPEVIDPFRLARQDEAFHETLAQATNNKAMFDLLHSVNERLYFTRMTDITTLDRMHTTCRHHLQILQAIETHDVAVARQMMQANVEFGRTNVESALRDALVRAYMSSQPN